jgi:RHS repeat-associated protein
MDKEEVTTYKVGDTNTKKTTRTEYTYDSYGNVTTEKDWGDTGITTDNSIITRTYYPNTTTNIVDKVAIEKVYLAADDTFTINESNLKQQTNYYYDGNNTALTTPPTKGMVTRVESKKDASNSVSTYSTYDSYGNVLTSVDANSNTTSTGYDTTYHIYPISKTYPITGLSESCTFDAGTGNVLTHTDVNSHVTSYEYDTFKRLTKTIKPGDSSGSPSITYQYNSWGTINSQNLKTITKVDGSNSIWSADYFDGLGRVVQTQAQSETSGHTMITGTTTFNTCGQVDKQYVSQDIPSALTAYYNTGIGNWKYSTSTYDALGRIVTQTAADGTTVSNDYTNVWQTVVTNERGFLTTYLYDAFNRLTQVQNSGVPTVITNTATSITGSSATLNGNLASLGGAGSVTVNFEWGLTTSYGNTTTGQPMSATGNFNAAISGLSGGTTYHFRAKAVGMSTGYGNDFTLTTPTVAPAVTSSAASGINPTTAMLNGALTTLGSATSVTISFQWGLTTSYGNTTTGQALTSPANFYAAISGLTATTTYHFRAKAVGSSTVYGSDQQFTTQASGGSPVEINKSVATGADDGFSGSGDFDNTDDWYEIGHPDSSTTYNAWFRFTGITIPAGATIEDAYLTLVQGQFDSGTVLKISADDSASPTAPTSQSNHTSKVRTTANVAWTSGYSDYAWHNSPSFTAVIQELVNSYTYSSGAIQILVDNNGSTSGKEAEGSTYEDSGYAPKLYIRYHTGGGGSSPPAVGTDAASSIVATSATLNGTLTSLGSVSSVQVSFEWGTDTNYGNATTPQAKTATGAFTAGLTGLNSNTVYHVRAKAVGATTTYGSDMVFQTSQSVNSVVTTTYTYDTLGNLTQVVDANNNTTTMSYDWLARKTGMSDPDMGSWSYGYDSNGNLTTQTDAKSQTITMVYDSMNRLTNKNYPTGSGMTNVVYTYDTQAANDNGNGKRTKMTDAMSDATHPSTYKYDNRGRVSEEKRWEYSNGTWNSYTTSYTYDGLDRAVTVTYPTGEIVTNAYNGRGLPTTVSGSVAGSLVTGTTYNQLGDITQINLGNNLKTNYTYWGLDYGTTAYGKLWEIKTQPQSGGTALQDMQYTWDAAGNLTQRQNLVSSETENFTYDSLDRLTAVSGAYTQSYAYNTIGNITSMNGTSYTYGDSSHKQAVTSVGTTNYAYDANGNMTTRGAQTIGWDVENRVISVTGGASFVYDGDGNRVKKTEGGQTILYINQYYEKNLTTGVVTTYYYLGGQLVAQSTGGTLKYIHQDSLGSTSVMSTSTGTSDSSIVYLPFGATRTGSVNTLKEFTGQRLDATGLYYYNARYYDTLIGRFISADKIGIDYNNPQTLNRYAYCSNNPLKYTDSSGSMIDTSGDNFDCSIEDPLSTNPPSPPTKPNPPTPPVKNDSPPLPVHKSSDTDTNTKVETAGVGAGTMDSSDAATVVEIVIIAGFFCPWAVIVAGIAAVVVVVCSSIPSDSTVQAVKAPGVPTGKDGYNPPKKWNGEKVKAPDGRYGYPDKDGNVWVPTGTPEQGGHGGPHWDVEHPGGGYGNYDNVFPK